MGDRKQTGKVAGGAFSVEACEASFAPDVIQDALEMAEARLSARDQRRLQSWLSLGDFPIPTVAIRVRAGDEPRQAIAAELAARLSSELRRAGPSPAEVAADRSQTVNLLGRMAKFLGATRPMTLKLSEREREIPTEVHGEVRREVIAASLKPSRPVDPASPEARAAFEVGRRGLRRTSARRYWGLLFKKQVKDLSTDVPVPIPVVQEFDRKAQAYAARNGIQFHHDHFNLRLPMMLLKGKIPSVNPREDVQHVDYGHNARQAEAVRHEAVHTMHVTQARVTIMRQVCEAYLVRSVEELPPEGLKEIEERVSRFEGGTNYLRLETMATKIGGASGKVTTSEREYRRGVLQGSGEVAQALKRDDLKLRVRAPFRAAAAAHFGGRTGKSVYEGIGTVTVSAVLAIAAQMGVLGTMGPAAWIAMLTWLAFRQPEFGGVIGAILSRLGAKY